MDYAVFDPYYAVNHLNQTTSLAHKKVAVESKYTAQIDTSNISLSIASDRLRSHWHWISKICNVNSVDRQPTIAFTEYI